MTLTASAAFLNSVFEGFDTFFLSFYHSIACTLLTAIFRVMTFIGEEGLIFVIISVILMCFSKTRRTGICLFGAVGCGGLITTIILKDIVARPRPFESEPFLEWWKSIGGPFEKGFSFPSGHVTGVTAGMTAIWLRKGRKWSIPAVVSVVLMCMARNYLMAHYPSDVLAAAVIGVFSAVVAWLITNLIYTILYQNRRKEWAAFVLNWSVPDIGGIFSRIGLIDGPGYAGSAEIARNVRADHAERTSRAVYSETDRTGTGHRTKQRSGEKSARRSSSGYTGKHAR